MSPGSTTRSRLLIYANAPTTWARTLTHGAQRELQRTQLGTYRDTARHVRICYCRGNAIDLIESFRAAFEYIPITIRAIDCNIS